MYDVIVIGAGPAGLAAALWCDDLGLDTLVIEQEEAIGGQLLRVYNRVENYPGLSVTNGRELIDRIAPQIDASDCDLWTNAKIKSVNLRARTVVLQRGEELQALSIIIATGVRPRMLGIPGEEEFIGRGIIASATRDRHLFANKDVCVVGGGDAAVENALLLAEDCATVTLVHRGRNLRARREFVEQIKTMHCLTFFSQSVVTRILGDEEVAAVEIMRHEAIKPFQMAVQGVLIRIGVLPNTELFTNQLELDEQGYIAVTSRQETNLQNVFAIGDVMNPQAPTISGAVGSGATAAKVIASRLNKR